MQRTRIARILHAGQPGETVDVRGWVRTKRESKQGFAFLELNDGSCLANLQVIVDASVPEGDATLKRIGTGASVAVVGEVKESPGREQRVEVHAKTLRLLGEADAQAYPLQKKRHSFEFLREIAHLRPRTNTFGAIARVRNALCAAIHNFFQSRGFLYVQTPIITTSDCEGAGQLFQVTTLDLARLARTPPAPPSQGGEPIRDEQARLPEQLRTHLRPLIERPRPYVASGISYLPFLERCRLLIVGGGHVGQKVAQLAAEVDFDVWVVDDRQEYCNPLRFPQAKRLIVGSIDSVLSGLEVDPNTYCLIVTRGHNHDEEALYHLAETSARYVGMIGSKRKIKLIFEDLLREGISREALARVHAPLGFHIGSQTVPEIAVSIVAELIAHRNLGHIPKHPRPASVLEEGHDSRSAGTSFG